MEIIFRFREIISRFRESEILFRESNTNNSHQVLREPPYAAIAAICCGGYYLIYDSIDLFRYIEPLLRKGYHGHRIQPEDMSDVQTEDDIEVFCHRLGK